MSTKKGPTSEIVGPAGCAQAQAVDRPTSLNLENQLARETQVHADDRAHGTTQTAWKASAIRLWLLLLAMLICDSTLNGAVDIYTSDAERSPQVDYHYQEKARAAATERQEQFRIRVSIQHAVGDDVPLAFPKSPSAGGKQAAATPPSESDGILLQGILLIIAAVVTVVVAVRMLAPEFFKAVFAKLSPWAAMRPANITANVRAEDEAFAKFLTTFQAGSTASPAGSAAVSSDQPEPAVVGREFYATAARLLATQRSLLQNIGCTTEDSTRRRLLSDMGREMNTFKVEAGSPEHLPAWQVASALEGLIKQLSDKVANATQSTLRTVAGAVDLLEELSRPGVRRDIMTNPPLRFLAVDDDMISRTAVSMALKKALTKPELADNGNAALGLAEKNVYDVIFLDVQMPGMDGFELCSRIRSDSANKDTPVVFVTCMSDFDARAQSILSGGNDLIGKPFLTFEITVKALTLALGRRLLRPSHETAVERDVAPSVASPLSATASPEETAVVPDVARTASTPDTIGDSPGQPADTDHHSLAMRSSDQELAEASSEPSSKLEHAFLTRTSRQLEILKDLIRSIPDTTDETTRQEMLAEFYLSLHALRPEMDSIANHPAMRVSTALEGLIRKLLESPANWTDSVLLTITNAVDLMEDLCAAGLNADLSVDSPIHILAVDDDLISRRAIVGALQIAFEKPVSVENGEAALALATERKFDLIFMDVQMPGMDGFEACSKIRQTKANSRTPVVFVTGHIDSRTRVQLATSGGSGLIAKPFLTAELTVKALTSALRGRIERGIPSGPLQGSRHQIEA